MKCELCSSSQREREHGLCLPCMEAMARLWTRNAVTHTADPGTARPLTGPGQGREEHIVARLELGSCRRPEAIDLGLHRS
jgi:hypothetical protein